MATAAAALLCALLALLVWVPVGWLMARRLPLGAELRGAAAPVLGWAVQGMAGWHASLLAGFTPGALVIATILLVLALLAAPRRAPPETGRGLGAWVFVAAALVALAPTLAVLPKVTPEGIALAAPLYDHAKIALIDEMVRSGVPPANPFVGGAEPGRIAYYYFWLFGAAELARLSGAGGWAADIAATWFTAFASLCLMSGLALRVSRGALKGFQVETGPGADNEGSRRPPPGTMLRGWLGPPVCTASGRTGGFWLAPGLVLLAALGGALRPVLQWLLGPERTARLIEPGSGLAGWLFQSSWSPHHVAAATACVLALALMMPLARVGLRPRDRCPAALAIAVLAAAGFASSLWVGGVAFPLCAAAGGLVLLARARPRGRMHLLLALSGAALLTLVLVFPLLREQLHAAGDRGGGPPILFAVTPVLGPAVPEGLRPLLEGAAYWLVLLPVEFPFAAVLGAIAAICLLARNRADPLIAPLVAAAVASLAAGGLLVSTVGENNDLGWRAVLPALLILTAVGAGWVAGTLERAMAPRMGKSRRDKTPDRADLDSAADRRTDAPPAGRPDPARTKVVSAIAVRRDYRPRNAPSRGRCASSAFRSIPAHVEPGGWTLGATALLLIGLSLPDGIHLLHANARGQLSIDAARFQDAPALWAAVRAHSGVTERVASNPRMTQHLAPWPIALSWALLSDRRSCFAGEELALAFTSRSPTARAAAAARFDRVFAGVPQADDLDVLVSEFHCRVVVLTPQDDAWFRDPFADDPRFARVEEKPGRWRIYRATP